MDGIRTGFFEQRLTKDVVERLRQTVLSTGPFDRDRELAAPTINWGAIRVRRGGQSVRADWCCGHYRPSPSHRQVATKEEARAIARLTVLLTHLKPGLPRSAWNDPKIRAYMPSRYAICGSIERPSLRLASLPRAARDLLRGKTRTYGGRASYLGPGRPPSHAPR